jgi:hypothetical protein
MDSSLSLKTGKYFSATNATYVTAREMLLVCPECGSPVHYKLREIPNNTPFFAHPKESKSLKLLRPCSLRIDGGTLIKASSSIPGLNHGQLVDKFQGEFCIELHKALGPRSDQLFKFLQRSKLEKIESKLYIKFISEIQSEAPTDEIVFLKMDASERTTLNEGVSDVCRFLRSPHGVWVGNFIYQTSYFIASILHAGVLNQSLGRGVFAVGKSHAILVAEGSRLKNIDKYSSGIIELKSNRLDFISRISGILVAHLILKWRFEAKPPSLLLIADAAFEQNEMSLRILKTGKKRNTLNELMTVSKSGISPAAITPSLIYQQLSREEYKPVPKEKLFSGRPGRVEADDYPAIQAIHIYEPYNIKDTDINRIIDLLAFGKILKKYEKRLSSRDEVLDWSRRKNPIEAYFLAANLDQNHEPPVFSDPSLQIKLQSWIEWARDDRMQYHPS